MLNSRTQTETTGSKHGEHQRDKPQSSARQYKAMVSISTAVTDMSSVVARVRVGGCTAELCCTEERKKENTQDSVCDL